MKTLKRLAAHAALGMSMVLSASAAMAELAIVANPSNPLNEISVGDVERIYLGKAKSFPGGGSANPVAQCLVNGVGAATTGEGLGLAQVDAFHVTHADFVQRVARVCHNCQFRHGGAGTQYHAHAESSMRSESL